jgi:hypothetical protein
MKCPYCDCERCDVASPNHPLRRELENWRRIAALQEMHQAPTKPARSFWERYCDEE